MVSPAPPINEIEPFNSPIKKRAKWLASGLLITILLSANLTQLLTQFSFSTPAVANHLTNLIEPFHISNQYRLFAVMTTNRPMIVIEGSLDGQNWEPYQFKWQPSQLDQHPRFITPHMPRFDWQLWFAPFTGYENNRWFSALQLGLLDNNPTILSLLAENPFPNERPLSVRANVYIYSYTNSFSDENWWDREFAGEYMPAIRAPNQ